MKIFQIFSLFLLLIKIHSQSNNNTKEQIINSTDKSEIKKEEKPFNLTESLINFFMETFGSNNTKSKNNTNQTENNADINDDDLRKIREAEMKNRLQAEKDKRIKEELDKKANLEKIGIENQKKKEEKIRQEEEFLLRVLSNNSFEEVVQIYLKKGEKETLYLDLKAKIKIKIAIMLTDSDPEEKINFFFSGPNARGRNTVIQQYYSKNYLFWEYETLYPGEYYAEITNKGTKLNEITFLFNDESHDKKKDLINTEKIDKISMLLNNIDNNINQLRNKKKIEIKQVNSHNKKVTENNKWIVIYSIIEICTMLLVFMIQSCYISSMVDKV